MDPGNDLARCDAVSIRGWRSGSKFNIAATDDAKRTLEGYIKGRIGAENKEFLRNGDVVSHVAMEFYDELTKEFTTIGCILDLPKSGNLKERFYLLDRISIHDELFLDKKYPRDYKSMKTYLKALSVDLAPFESQRKYREAIARFFWNGCDEICAHFTESSRLSLH